QGISRVRASSGRVFRRGKVNMPGECFQGAAMAAGQDTARPDGIKRAAHAEGMPLLEHRWVHMRRKSERRDTDAGPVVRFIRVVGTGLGELLNLCAAYLGIAVLVTLTLVLTMAPLRSQLAQIHQSLVMALRPANMDDVLVAMLATDDDNLSLLERLTGTGELPSRSVQQGQPDSNNAEAIREDAINFARLLKDSAQQGRVEGITAAQE